MKIKTFFAHPVPNLVFQLLLIGNFAIISALIYHLLQTIMKFIIAAEMLRAVELLVVAILFAVHLLINWLAYNCLFGQLRASFIPRLARYIPVLIIVTYLFVLIYTTTAGTDLVFPYPLRTLTRIETDFGWFLVFMYCMVSLYGLPFLILGLLKDEVLSDGI